MSAIIEELRKADRIINVMLNAMTIEQKSKCAAQLEAEGVSPDGMVRANEREAALAAGDGLAKALRDIAMYSSREGRMAWRALTVAGLQ